MSEEEFYKIRMHIVIFAIAAVVIALDMFVWRP